MRWTEDFVYGPVFRDITEQRPDDTTFVAEQVFARCRHQGIPTIFTRNLTLIYSLECSKTIMYGASGR
jgi:hypothetical protein